MLLGGEKIPDKDFRHEESRVGLDDGGEGDSKSELAEGLREEKALPWYKCVGCQRLGPSWKICHGIVLTSLPRESKFCAIDRHQIHRPCREKFVPLARTRVS
ncbi:uncharacterized protein LOC112351257 [Selaginella moellendorffii]|uniref:uncharacterized protein LOC112351257 n=1 Tax=Selaginella moellendorffii TaxID=88036 RepID=UPI000D1C7BD0|nr:uncharacterized protein LOC112351257 [Selaginella moellendorffii]|eukprot:XP_024544529.1 uncharacterized protein LOC112351257 [Selaginella moellendorffii]